MIVGIDEVGRGAWAGPLVVGAVLLGGAEIPGLTDSKRLTKKQRERLDGEIRRQAQAIGLGWVSARQIDTIGLSAALKLAARRALLHIRHDFSEIIIDGTIRLIDHPKVTLMKKADLLIPSVSAASIVAKVARDHYMKHLDGVFDGYAFKSHVGYGTAAHRQALQDRGVSPVHRRSFAPIAQLLGDSPVIETNGNTQSTVTTKQRGDVAEALVAEHLRAQGHTITARNWRTRYCEIDIVSQKAKTLYFTEVKYRRSAHFGGGFGAITPKKLQQMAFAAELFVTKHGFSNIPRQLLAAEVEGMPPRITELVELS